MDKKRMMLLVGLVIVLALGSSQSATSATSQEPLIDLQLTDAVLGRDGNNLTITPIVRVAIKGGSAPDIGITIQIAAHFADGTVIQNVPDDGGRSSTGPSCASNCATGVQCQQLAACPPLQLFGITGMRQFTGKCALVEDTRSADEQGRSVVGSCSCVYRVEATSPISRPFAQVAPGQRVMLDLDPNEFQPELNEQNNTREIIIPGGL